MKNALRLATILSSSMLACAALLHGAAAAAEELAFGPDLQRAGWSIVSFPGIAPASFKASGRARLEVSSDAAAGLLWRALDGASGQSRRARWRWRVDEGVPPTDLSKRGADDRALGVYFVFGTSQDAGKSATKLLAAPSVTALVYVFGGDRPRGAMVVSPHMGARGRFIVLRHADAPKAVWFSEDVDFAGDHLRAFGKPPPLLLAVAIMSDSDDTRARNRGALQTLTLD